MPGLVLILLPAMLRSLNVAGSNVLTSSFYGLSIFMGDLMPKPFLLNNINTV